MTTDSSAAGYLAPATTPTDPVYDSALDRVLHDIIQRTMGISDPTLVRPRWQAEPPAQPSFATNWAAFGVTVVNADVFAALLHDPAGADILQRTEELEVLVSTYGPAARANMVLLRDGLSVEQNRDGLAAIGANLVECRTMVNLPALLKEKWLPRVDMTVVLRRKVVRTYPVLNITSASFGLDNEQYVTNLHTP